jgi:hypothetical protein
MVLNAYFLDSSQAMASSANSGVHQLVQHWLRTHAVCEVSVQSLVLNNLGVDFLGMRKKKTFVWHLEYTVLQENWKNFY